MKIGVYGQYIQDSSQAVLQQLLNCCASYETEVHIYKDYADLFDDPDFNLPKVFTAIDSSFDCVISIGGDGTILRAVGLIGESQVPVLGINTGRLGFLAMVIEQDIRQVVHALINKEFTLSKRSLISLVSSFPGDHVAPQNFALNEVTVSRQNTTSMIQIATYLDGALLTHYWADGLIISTPTGSTGYSLSCGGPVVSPQTGVFIITPIAPHNLNARPLVISDATEIKVKVYGREDSFLASLDNRIASYPDETTLTLTKAAFTANLIQFNDVQFFDTIRHKLLWGEDKRN